MATYCKMQRVDYLVSLIAFNDESIRKVEHKKKNYFFTLDCKPFPFSEIRDPVEQSLLCIFLLV